MDIIAPLKWLVGKLPRHPDSVVATRYDGFENSYLGYGTPRDKLAYSTFSLGDRLDDLQLDALYYSDDVSARIVNLKPAEMFRCGYVCKADNPDAAQQLQDQGKALNLDTHVLRAMQWGRLRGALLVLGALDQAEDLTTPLDVSRVREVAYLNVVDSRFASVVLWQDNPLLPEFDKPLVYSVGSRHAPILVHASRVIQFDGVPETDPHMRRHLNGWTFSVLQRPYDVIRKFTLVYESAAQLMADASQGVWKVQGLLDALGKNKQAVIDRIALSDMTRSSGRAVMVDAELEDYTRVPTSFAGVDAILDRFQQRLSAASDGIPVTILMGRSPAGQNATGDGDFRGWYASIASAQENELKPVLMHVYAILAGGELPEGFDIEFRPLWEPTDAEKAATERTRAETDKIYALDIGCIEPERIAIARFGSGEGTIEVDEEELLRALDVEKSFAKELEQARSTLGEKELAALSIAQGVSPIIVSSLINAAGKDAAAGGGAPTPGAKKAPPDDAK